MSCLPDQRYSYWFVFFCFKAKKSEFNFEIFRKLNVFFRSLYFFKCLRWVTFLFLFWTTLLWSLILFNIWHWHWLLTLYYWRNLKLTSISILNSTSDPPSLCLEFVKHTLNLQRERRKCPKVDFGRAEIQTANLKVAVRMRYL